MDYSEWAEIAINHIDEVVCSVDKTGSIVATNKTWERVFGHKSNNLIGKTFVSLVTKSDRERTAKLLKSIIEKKTEPSTQFNCKIESIGSQVINVSWIAKWLPGKKLVNIVSTNLSNTDNRILINSGEKMKNLMKGMVVGLIVTDSNGKIETLNPMAEHMFCCEAESLSGKHISILFADTDRSGNHLWPINELSNKLSKMICARRSGEHTGELFATWVAAAKLKGNNGDLGYLLNFVDLDQELPEG